MVAPPSPELRPVVVKSIAESEGVNVPVSALALLISWRCSRRLQPALSRTLKGATTWRHGHDGAWPSTPSIDDEFRYAIGGGPLGRRLRHSIAVADSGAARFCAFGGGQQVFFGPRFALGRTAIRN